ncbi:transcriptional repressor [Candidatus Gracilibacteria bacterium]|nr:transcriptional repressor [Candidatus Gracilibacteria bacterium]
MKNTPLKTTVIDILSSQRKPVSVPILMKLLSSKKYTPNKTTLYRLLGKMKKESLVEEILLDSNLSFYELKSHNHHHHFMCEKCKAIHCVIDKPLEKIVNQLEHKLKNKGLQIQSHQFSFSGYCKNCIS